MNKNMLRELNSGYSLSKELHKTLYHNTKLLLELYSIVSWRLETSLNEIELECQENLGRSLIDVFDSIIDIDPRINEVRLKSRLSSIEESKSILSMIDVSLERLKRYPGYGRMYYSIIHSVYIEREVESIEALAEEFNVSRSTMYRNIKKAIKVFSVVLWGYMINEMHVWNNLSS